MFSLSTSWNAHRHTSGRALVNEIKAIGFDTVELNFTLTEKVVEEILAHQARLGIKVSSLHNICPLPREVSPERASPDYYALSSDDADERRLAVKAAERTLLYAKRFGAAAIVVHAGRVPVKDRTRDLAVTIDDKGRFAEFRVNAIRERREHSGGCIGNVIKSLEELVPFAQGVGVAIGIENRYYYREIPILEEFDILFRHFKPGEIYYWHDTGHAEVFDRLGLVSHKELLSRFSGRLLGIHLHDIIGPITDHQAPGLGTFDFSIIRPHLRPETIMVMEVHAPASADQIRAGEQYLTKILK